MTELSSSALASTSGLPGWGSDFVEEMVSKYGGSTFGNYKKAVDDLALAPALTEESRVASNRQFSRDLMSELGEATNTASRELAYRGTSASSVGAEYAADMAASALDSVVGQHEDSNQGAATKDYKNLVLQSEAKTNLAGMLGSYLGATKESVDYGELGGGDAAGPPDTTTPQGTAYTVTQGSTGKSKTKWEEPPQWDDLETKSLKGDDWHTDGTYAFRWDNETGMVSDIHLLSDEGEWVPYDDAVAGSTEISAEEFATTTGLPDWGNEFVQGLVDDYGSELFGNASAAANAVTAGQGFTDNQKVKLDEQYDLLSGPVGAALAAANRSILGTPSADSLTEDYGYRMFPALLDEELDKSKGRQRTSDTEWATEQKTQNLEDSVNAQGALSGLIGDYLNLANYSYSPELSALLGLGFSAS